MIDVRNLSYLYDGNETAAVNSVSFTIAEGEVFGFLGPSGSGKSTTQRILCRLLDRYTGSVKIMDREVSDWDSTLYEHIGVGFELPNHYEKLTAHENLTLFAAMYPQPSDVDQLLDKVGLLEVSARRVASYSKGMKMRLNFARALLGSPKILFMDEPTSGLDPVNGAKLKEQIKALRDSGVTIFLTTHNMQDADELCDKVAFIVNGEIIQLDSPYNLKHRYGKPSVKVEYKSANELMENEFPLPNLGENAEFIELLKTHDVSSIHSLEATLERVFIEVTGEQLT